MATVLAHYKTNERAGISLTLIASLNEYEANQLHFSTSL